MESEPLAPDISSLVVEFKKGGEDRFRALPNAIQRAFVEWYGQPDRLVYAVLDACHGDVDQFNLHLLEGMSCFDGRQRGVQKFLREVREAFRAATSSGSPTIRRPNQAPIHSRSSPSIFAIGSS